MHRDVVDRAIKVIRQKLQSAIGKGIELRPDQVLPIAARCALYRFLC